MCSGPKSVQVDYIEVFTAMSNPCFHDLTDLFSTLALEEQALDVRVPEQPKEDMKTPVSAKITSPTRLRRI